MTSGSATSGPSALLRSCATPPASTLKRLHSLRRGQPFLHAALVQHARLHQLLAQADALERGRDLVAERRVGVDPVGVVERDDAQQLVLERQREDEEALPRVVRQRARRQQLAGGVLHVLALQQLAVAQAHRGSQHVPGRARHAREIGGADAGVGQTLDQRVPQRRQVEGDRRLLADAEQAQVVLVEQQAVLHLAGRVGKRDQVQPVEEDALDLQVRPAPQLVAQIADRAVKHALPLVVGAGVVEQADDGLVERLALACRSRRAARRGGASPPRRRSRSRCPEAPPARATASPGDRPSIPCRSECVRGTACESRRYAS